MTNTIDTAALDRWITGNRHAQAECPECGTWVEAESGAVCEGCGWTVTEPEPDPDEAYDRRREARFED